MAIRQALGRHVLVATALFLPLLMVACDPRRDDSSSWYTETGKNSGVVVSVKPSRQLIGDERYAPQITVTNSLEAALAVTAVELSTKQKTYRASYPRPQDFPIEVLPGQTQSLTVTAW
jgi:hypothetical protein